MGGFPARGGHKQELGVTILRCVAPTLAYFSVVLIVIRMAGAGSEISRCVCVFLWCHHPFNELWNTARCVHENGSVGDSFGASCSLVCYLWWSFVYQLGRVDVYLKKGVTNSTVSCYDVESLHGKPAKNGLSTSFLLQ